MPDDLTMLTKELLDASIITPKDPEPKQKLPLFRESAPAQPFPIEAMGAAQDAAYAIALTSQAPQAMCAQSVLAAITLTVQAHRNVELPGGGVKPLNGFFASIAESGERKTGVDNLALAPVYDFEKELYKAYGDELETYNNDRAAWEAARAEAKKKGKGNRADIRAALNAVGAEPRAPRHPMILVTDPSMESIAKHLGEGRPWCGVFTNEGGVFVGGHAFSQEKAMHTGGALNDLWDGKAIRRLRVGTGTQFLPGRRCSVHIMMQSVVASRLLGDSLMDGMGLLARLLTVAPESTQGTRGYREQGAEEKRLLAEYRDRMKCQLERKPRMMADVPEALDPEVMVFDAKAKGLWVSFYNTVERENRDGGEFCSIRGFSNKLAEHAGRLAAMLSVYADPDAMVVDAHHMACGIALAQHYASEMLRLSGSAGVDPELEKARRLLTWWQALPSPDVYLKQIIQKGPNEIRDKAKASEAIQILEEHGQIVRLPKGTVIDGSKRNDAWTIAP